MKFDFMIFSGGFNGDEFVISSKQYTKQQAIELFRQETDLDATEDMIRSDQVRYYLKVPEWCGSDSDTGCYTYARDTKHGSFPVWVINMAKARQRIEENV